MFYFENKIKTVSVHKVLMSPVPESGPNLTFTDSINIYRFKKITDNNIKKKEWI